MFLTRSLTPFALKWQKPTCFPWWCLSRPVIPSSHRFVSSHNSNSQLRKPLPCHPHIWGIPKGSHEAVWFHEIDWWPFNSSMRVCIFEEDVAVAEINHYLQRFLVNQVEWKNQAEDILGFWCYQNVSHSFVWKSAQGINWFKRILLFAVSSFSLFWISECLESFVLFWFCLLVFWVANYNCLHYLVGSREEKGQVRERPVQ